MDFDSGNTHHEFTDHLGRLVSIPLRPQRIVSLCPSQTATLYYLGLGARIAGRTRFCIHPQPEVENALRIGGTKEVKYDRIKALQPDLIIAEKEENTPEMVDKLARDYPVFVTDVRDVESALSMVRDLGSITGKQSAGNHLAAEIENAMHGIPRLDPELTCLYLIWREPWMAAGGDTFIGALLDKLGFINLALDWEGRYPEFDLSSLTEHRPEVVMLSSEPFPFAQKHIAEIRQLLPDSKVILVDGEMFSWYGSRMLAMPPYFSELIRTLQ